jgi:hypothetical protein
MIFVESRTLDKGPAARAGLCVEGIAMLQVPAFLHLRLVAVAERHHDTVDCHGFSTVGGCSLLNFLEHYI